VLIGFPRATAFAGPLGTLRARSRPVEHFFLPLASALMPIPSLAWVPVFILWFGLGDIVAILIVFYAAVFPVLLNTWSGVRAVNPLWLRAAGAMGADEAALFWKVMIPGAFPFIITGLRQAFLRAWIAVVGAEMLAASDWGLGWVIFDAKEFLNADVMLASLVVIGAIGFIFERLVFGSLERATVLRWGMVRVAKSYFFNGNEAPVTPFVRSPPNRGAAIACERLKPGGCLYVAAVVRLRPQHARQPDQARGIPRPPGGRALDRR